MNLFEIPPDRPSRRQNRRKQVAEWKRSEMRVRTQDAGPNWPDSSRWIAVSMTECAEHLEGYGITPETEMFELFSGFCRLLEEMGLMHYGPTEFLACEALVKRLEKEEKV